jgi:hypothetical protein
MSLETLVSIFPLVRTYCDGWHRSELSGPWRHRKPATGIDHCARAFPPVFDKRDGCSSLLNSSMNKRSSTRRRRSTWRSPNTIRRPWARARLATPRSNGSQQFTPGSAPRLEHSAATRRGRTCPARAASRRPGPPKRLRRALSCVSATARRSPTCISRTNPAGARRPICSHYEARRIVAHIAKLPGLLRKPSLCARGRHLPSGIFNRLHREPRKERSAI